MFKIVLNGDDKPIWNKQDVHRVVEYYGKGVICGLPKDQSVDSIVSNNLKWFVDPVKGVVLFEQFIPATANASLERQEHSQ